jgi:CxxC motif-containing protein
MDLYCITCPVGCKLDVSGSGDNIRVEGNNCPKGVEFAEAEVNNPMRTLTTTVRTNFPDVPVISVRTDGEIPKSELMNAMHELNEIVIEEELGCGDTVLEDVAETGVRVIVTSSVLMQLGAELENKNVQLGKLSPTGESAAMEGSESGFGMVRNSGALDHIGTGLGGFVGTAGEAVGVDDLEDEEEEVEDAAADTQGELIKSRGRPHIKRGR